VRATGAKLLSLHSGVDNGVSVRVTMALVRDSQRTMHANLGHRQRTKEFWRRFVGVKVFVQRGSCGAATPAAVSSILKFLAERSSQKARGGGIKFFVAISFRPPISIGPNVCRDIPSDAARVVPDGDVVS